MTVTTNPSYVHLELLSQNGETGKKGVGSKPFVLILKPTFETDGTDAIIKANLMHSVDVLQGASVKLPEQFPFIAYPEDTGFGGVNRNSSWVYLSQRNILTQTEAIKTWMIKVATELTAERGLPPEKLKIETGGTTATLLKLGWSATELAK